MNKYQLASLAASHTGGTYDMQGLISDSIVESAKLYTQANASFTKNLYFTEVEKGENRNIDLFLDDKKIATRDIMIHVSEDALDKVMPNGDCARNLVFYTWDDFEKLEAEIAKQDDFVDAVADISESGLELS